MGLDILIKAFKLLKDKLAKQDKALANKLRLLIVGDGALTMQLRNQVELAGLSNVSRIVGAVPHAQVKQYINEIDLFVVSSRIESFGVSVVEAAACERACIVSNVGGLPEVVLNEKTGLIVESEVPQAFADALEYLIFNRDVAIEMGKNARIYALEKYAENLTMKIMVEMLNNNSVDNHANQV